MIDLLNNNFYSALEFIYKMNNIGEK